MSQSRSNIFEYPFNTFIFVELSSTTSILGQFHYL